jgi:MFS transporter, DHA1 family, multidrug resistance protein
MTSPTASGLNQSRTEFILLLSCILMLIAFAIDSMLPAFPAIGKGLGVTDKRDYALILSAFLTGFSIALLFVGTLSDRFGRRRLILVSLTGFVVTSFIAALASDYTILLIARFAQGMSAAGGQVVVRAIVRDRFVGRDMAQVMSMTSMIFMAGPIIAPFMGQSLLLVSTWRSIFFVLAALGFVIWSWSFFRLQESLPSTQRLPINSQTIIQSVKTVLSDRLSLGYTLAQAAGGSALFGFLMSVQPVFEQTLKAPDMLPVGFAVMAGCMMAASLFNAMVVKRYGMRRIGHIALIAYTAIAGVHVLVALWGYETLAMFITLQSLMMIAFPMMGGNFNAIAMENMGHVAGTASSVQGFLNNIISTGFGAMVAYAFDGTTVPMYSAYVFFGLIAITIIFITEKGKLFSTSLPQAV